MSKPEKLPIPLAEPEAEVPRIHVAPGPHISAPVTTWRMMVDVALGLLPVLLAAVWFFRWHAVLQVAVCALGCTAAEAVFARLRGRRAPLADGSALVTGLILGLSLPWSAPVYVGVVGSFVAIGVGKAAFGGLGQNIFNPAMVGRAFVMISFASVLGATAYVSPEGPLDIVTQATPLTVAKEAAGEMPGLWPLFVGSVNGSLGETSALACLIGGLFLCLRRAAAWQIPASMIVSAAAVAGLANLVNPETPLTVLHHLAGGSLLFGAVFIATDPVTSPLAPKGRAVFGAGVGALVIFIRLFSNYPEGVVFAVLLMNATVPLINRWTIPRPFGAPKKATVSDGARA
ncbi:MAG: RnfABCDGE type electron transport complex subunit D [bacterium]|nr:RnfABCDGE type electron transport complex subunit D [bacterium]